MLKTKINKKINLSVFTYFFLKNSFLFFLIFLLFISAGFVKVKVEKIHVQNKTDFVEAYVNIFQKKIRTNENLTYYWYKSRSINLNKGSYAGKLLEGEFNRFNLNNKLIEQGQFKKGLKIGLWRSWFENGNLKSSCNYKKGLKHGKEIKYNRKGLVVNEVKYSKGNIIF